MNRCQIYAVIVSFFALVALANVANAQSQDRDNPTKLTSSEISGLIDSESAGKFYYYTFTVNPGEVTITLDVESNPPINSYVANYKLVEFTLYDRNAARIASKGVLSTGRGTEQGVSRVDIARRQTVTLKVAISDAAFTSVSNGGGKYRIRVGGAVELGNNDSTVTENGSFLSSITKKGDDSFLSSQPSLSVILFSEAETLKENKQYNEAIKKYTQALNVSPPVVKMAFIYPERGKCKFELQDYEGAIADYTQSIKLYCDSDDSEIISTKEKDDHLLSDYYFLRGEAKEKLGEKTDARIDFRESCKLGNTDACAKLQIR